MWACMIPAAILSYGGINSFVIIFAIYPVALKIFEDADLPTRLLPGIVCGGISLVYESIGDVFLDYAQQGYNLEFIHRLAADGCGGLDSLPWNGSIVSVFAICHTTHKKSYLDAFITGLLIPMLATFAVDLPIILILG